MNVIANTIYCSLSRPHKVPSLTYKFFLLVYLKHPDFVRVNEKCRKPRGAKNSPFIGKESHCHGFVSNRGIGKQRGGRRDDGQINEACDKGWLHPAVPSLFQQNVIHLNYIEGRK